MKRTFELHKEILGKERVVTEIHIDTNKLTDYLYSQLDRGRKLDDIIEINEYYTLRGGYSFPFIFPQVQVRLDNGFEYDAFVIYSYLDDKYIFVPVDESLEKERGLCEQFMIYDENDVREFRKTYELIAEVFVEIKNAKQDMLSALSKAGK